MVSECDTTIRTAIPAIRIAVAQLLNKKYMVPQGQIAKKLGVTQAAVNKYINGKYSVKISAAVNLIKRKGYDSTIAELVMSGKGIAEVNAKIDKVASSIYLSRTQANK